MLDPNALPPWPLVLLAFAVAFLYASVGLGGGSGYLAAMSLFAVATPLIASTALTLNILAASIAFLTYRQSGYFQPALLWPFLLTSLPAAFLGGYLRLPETIYLLILYAVLGYIGLQLLFWEPRVQTAVTPRRFSWLVILLSGFVIGLLSGMVGLGGGIFLSPLIVLAGWGTPKQAAAASSAFIVVNSASGLLGRVLGGTFVLGMMGAALLPAGLIGAVLGSRLGARYLSGLWLRRLLGIVLLLTVLSYLVQSLAP
ncbi:MAG: sulfite exporter TauE/SafE family protein [Caldilinea sp. CFX5]|nr:sulfite exporter TauE/SafE family protein [Caldilinea sp. CFX5]